MRGETGGETVEEPTQRPRITILATASEHLQALREMVAWAKQLYLAYAWMDSGHGSAAHWQVLNLEKVARAVIGIHFAQTEPYALRLLARRRHTLKVVNDTSGIFHPKVLVGVNGARAQAIMGSSNLTGGGFSGNTELNVRLEGLREAEPLVRILSFIEAQWHSARAFIPDDDWLTRYEAAHRRRPSPPRVPERPRGSRVIVRSAAELNIPWDAFYGLIAEQERRTLANGFEIHVFDHPKGSYLQEVERCRAVFEQHTSFTAMSEEERKLVAGCGGGTTGYFGSMTGAGYFRQMVSARPQRISERLDEIPLTGTVAPARVRAYFESIIALKGISFGTASRLLCMKRPDCFLPLNNANKERIREVFGQAPATVPGYLQLHNRLWEYPWFRATEPQSTDERRVWYARVALLDALLYELPPYQAWG